MYSPFYTDHVDLTSITFNYKIMNVNFGLTFTHKPYDNHAIPLINIFLFYKNLFIIKNGNFFSVLSN